MNAESHTHGLGGLDGSNPLAFLAALGTLATVAGVDRRARMAWQQSGGAWRPSLESNVAADEEGLVHWLAERLSGMHTRLEFDLGSSQDNITVEPPLFESFVRQASEDASPADRREADFAAAYGCERVVNPSNGKIEDSALRTMTGSGGQNFLKIMRSIIQETDASHLRRTLFAAWDYADPMKALSLRWDPADDRRYAYRWTDPGDPGTRRAGSMLGGNRLAIEGMPLLPTFPTRRGVQTAGFRRRGRRIEWTWPIWTPLIDSSTVRSLLQLELLQHDRPDAAQLRRVGVHAVFRSQRVRPTKHYRNFSPATEV